MNHETIPHDEAPASTPAVAMHGLMQQYERVFHAIEVRNPKAADAFAQGVQTQLMAVAQENRFIPQEIIEGPRHLVEHAIENLSHTGNMLGTILQAQSSFMHGLFHQLGDLSHDKIHALRPDHALQALQESILAFNNEKLNEPVKPASSVEPARAAEQEAPREEPLQESSILLLIPSDLEPAVKTEGFPALHGTNKKQPDTKLAIPDIALAEVMEDTPAIGQRQR